MIDLYYWTTPNGHKITIFLEETGVPYTIKPINIGKGEQFNPDFLKISPNNRIPAIVDHEPADEGEPLSIFESGAILEYLAMKTGAYLPSNVRGRAEVMQWLFWQMGGLGPMLGQNHHFRNYSAEKITYAIERYTKETERLYGVLDDRLADRPFVANDYSTWLVIRGSCCTNGRARISMIFPISSVGLKRFKSAPPSSAPMLWRAKSTPTLAA